MSLKKSIDATHGNRTAAEVSVRAKQEAKVFELGMPATPAFLWNNKPLYSIWKKYSKFLLDKRLLSYADGDALLELCEAQLTAPDGERKKKALAVFKRTQFPAPIVDRQSVV